jgi:uncharacterized protein (TIGR04255 family)
MSVLPNAPLVEAIFELRWGNVRQVGDEFHFSTSPTEELLPGQFRSLVSSEGFIHYERINLEAPPLPHIVFHRYRPKEKAWPCFQIGTGIFTTNQINDGYTWESFKEAILNGINFLNKSHPDGENKITPLGVELKYQDAFLLESGETCDQFLQKKICLGFSPPTDFLANSNLKEGMKNYKISFSLDLISPKGLLIININQGLINQKPAMIMETVVRSADENKPPYNLEYFSNWLEEAHNIQRHTFNTLIATKLHETFE